MNGKMVHIHNDRSCFARSPMARLHVTGTVGEVFARLNERLEDLQNAGQVELSVREAGDPDAAARSSYLPAGIDVLNAECCRPAVAGRLLKAPQVYRELICRLPRETRFFIDNSNSVPWTIHYFFHPRPESYHLSIEFATMAWAVGAAIGGAFADRRAPSVCITGDGCYLMSGQEITVAVEQGLPVIFVVLNDRAYGLIRHGHSLLGREQIDYAIPPVDFGMMARAAGAEAYTVRNAKDLDLVDWQSLATSQFPTLIDVHVDPEEKPPLSMA
jgi:acetolactate synthase-1/2/3 large subunit